MPPEKHKEIEAVLSGKVQGVGLRPAIYRLAVAFGLSGYVQNESAEVVIGACGPAGAVEDFLEALRNINLPGCEIAHFRLRQERTSISNEKNQNEAGPPFHEKTNNVLPAKREPRNTGEQTPLFLIRNSQSDSGPAAFLTVSDRGICPACVFEIFRRRENGPEKAAASRRSEYLFNSCAHCGPRYTIMRRMPFDRGNTSMSDFPFCPDCAAEYGDPDDRRFHAQTTGCPSCGPELKLHFENKIFSGELALEELARAVRNGEVAAVKGTGGFHLICDAACDEAVRRIRQIKRRPEKPFAVLYPSIEFIEREYCPGRKEKAALLSHEKPVVLLAPANGVRSSLSFHVNRGIRRTGVFLPDSALYLRLMQKLGFPVVATSFNLSGEPLISSFEEIKREDKIAVATHNRKIENRCDESVISFAGPSGRPVPIRLGRGFAPAVISLPHPVRQNTLALGGALKNTITLARKKSALAGPHLGDIGGEASEIAFDRDCRRLMKYYHFTPEVVVCDKNPALFSHQWGRRFAEEIKIPFRSVYHHHAHALSLMAECGIPAKETLFTAVWDGAGLGPDSSVWGGEFLLAGYDHFERIFSFRPFYLAGSTSAAKYPYKTAASILFELFGEEAFKRCPHVWQNIASPNTAPQEERGLFFAAWKKRLNMPRSSSAGRLFDAAASILNVCHANTFEGEAAMRLEDCAGMSFSGFTSLPVQNGIIDWAPLFEALTRFADPGQGAAFFINSLAHTLVLCARTYGRLGLSGGVFQNAKLVSKTAALSRSRGIRLLTHRKVPCNDGGLSLGQALYLDK